jgi:SAM-dependent methyltransferase
LVFEKVKKCSLCESKRIACVDSKIDMCKCLNCGYFFTSPRPNRKSIKKYYSKCDNYDYWISLEKDFDILSLRRLQILRRYIKSGDILDIGAGIGQFLYFAKKYFNIFGTEVATSAIIIAKNKYGVKLAEGDMEDLKFNHRFDAITIFHVLEHVHEPGELISKCYSLLKKDGIVVIAVPNDINKFINLRTKRLLRFLKIGRFKDYGEFGMAKTNYKENFGEIHLSQFTPIVLEKAFRDRNFKILTNTLDPYYVPTNFRNNLKYWIFLGIKKITGLNFYDTILLVAKKK